MFEKLRDALEWVKAYIFSLGKMAAHNQASSVSAGLAFAWICFALYMDIGRDVIIAGGLAVFLVLVPLLNMITDNPTDADDQ